MSEFTQSNQGAIEETYLGEANGGNNQTLRLLYPTSGDVVEISPTSRKAGMNALRKFSSRSINFSEVPPFLVEPTYQLKAAQASAALGIIGSNRHTLGQEATRVLMEGRPVLALPRLNRFYRWIDFHEVSRDTVNAEVVLESHRVLDEDRNLNSQSWYGPDTQLFLDYLAGREDITPPDLSEFRARVTSNSLVIIGVSNGRVITVPRITLPINSKPEVICKPKYDSNRDYSWLEGYPDSNSTDTNLVFSKRFYKGKAGLYNWPGTDAQSFIDWVLGVKPFEMASGIRLQRSNEAIRSIHIIQGSAGRLTITISPSANHLTRFIVVPNRDELYEWGEIYGDESDNQPLLISTTRVTRENHSKLNSNWVGPVKQPYLDYLDNKLVPEALKPFTTDVLPSKTLYLFIHKGKVFAVDLRKSNPPVKVGEKIKVVPTIHNNSVVLSLEADDNSRHFARYFLDRENNTFTRLAGSIEVDITAEEADADLDKFLDLN